MANSCKTCKYFRKETVEIALVSAEYATWINLSNPNIEGAPAYDLAQCSNKNVTNGIITRSETTQWFFNTKKYTDTFGSQAVAGENDICGKFEAKV